MGGLNKALLWVSLFLEIVILLVLVFILFKGYEREELNRDYLEEHIHIASVYESSGLLRDALSEYDEALRFADEVESRTLLRKAGDLAFEKLGDYDLALKYYLRAREVEESEDAKRALGERIVTSLERSGREAEARAWLDELTFLKRGLGKEGSGVVAKIGEREISLGEVERSFYLEPEVIRNNFSGENGFRDYVHRYVLKVLAYQAALGEGYVEREWERVEKWKRDYLSELYLRERVVGKLEPTEEELKEYFAEHKGEFPSKGFEELKGKLRERLIREREDARLREWFEKEAKEKRVIMYEQVLGK